MIDIRAWGEDVGQLVEHKGIIKFKYSETNCLDFSPIKMPMANRSVQNFSHLGYQYGLPGLISDHLPGSYGMDYMFKIAQKLNLSQAHKEQMAKVILFNAIFGNRDDHSKNFSFLMNSKGKWAFAPAYDLTYTSNGYHQMLLGNYSLNRATIHQIRDAFKPYNISESFLKENIEMMIDIKNNKLVKEGSSLGIPEKLAKQILEETKFVDELFTKGDY